jgi:hypothetical protein
MLTANIEDGPRGPSSKLSLGFGLLVAVSQSRRRLKLVLNRDDRSSAESATKCGEEMNHGRHGRGERKKKNGTTNRTNLHEWRS